MRKKKTLEERAIARLERRTGAVTREERRLCRQAITGSAKRRLLARKKLGIADATPTSPLAMLAEEWAWGSD